jgi:hypothetical protein
LVESLLLLIEEEKNVGVSSLYRYKPLAIRCVYATNVECYCLWL